MRQLSLMSLILSFILAGCAGDPVPVALSKAPVPKECKERHYADLPDVPSILGTTATTQSINSHWAKHHRLQSRPRYRSLYRAYTVCSRYARGS